MSLVYDMKHHIQSGMTNNITPSSSTLAIFYLSHPTPTEEEIIQFSHENNLDEQDVKLFINYLGQRIL